MRMIYWFTSNSYIITPITNPSKQKKHQTPVAAESSSKTGTNSAPTNPNPLGLEPTKTKVVLGSLLWAPSLQLHHWVKSKEVVGIGGRGVAPLRFPLNDNLLGLTCFELFHFSAFFFWHLKNAKPQHKMYVVDVELLRLWTAIIVYTCTLAFPYKTQDPEPRDSLVWKVAIPHISSRWRVKNWSFHWWLESISMDSY